MDDTLDATPSRRTGSGRAPRPGLVVVYTGKEPALRRIPVDGAVALGRGGLGHDDKRMSRHHAEVRIVEGAWAVRDLESRNGTYVDGARVRGEVRAERARVLRVGDTLLLFRDDVAGIASVVQRSGAVLGPLMQKKWLEIEHAVSSPVLYVTGPTGTGKELAARHFHAAGPRPAGPFININCASLAPPLAERLLFGARRGAYSGADTDACGHFQAADGGTLVLDEIAELAPGVQATLLRAVESGEVMPLGAPRPHKVDVRICVTTNEDLRAAVVAGRFRKDLYYRLARATVTLPALDERPEEIPWLIAAALGEAHSSFVEAALLRRWEGNVRELLAAVAAAARRARADGSELRGRHLERAPEAAGSTPDGRRAAVVEALRASDGNVAAAARTLGVHRTQLRRWMAAWKLK